jgi:hypothetical protein
MNPQQLGRALQSLPMRPRSTCTHGRMISDSVSEEEHMAGKVRCIECGSVIPDPHLQQEAKGT